MFIKLPSQFHRMVYIHRRTAHSKSQRYRLNGPICTPSNCVPVCEVTVTALAHRTDRSNRWPKAEIASAVLVAAIHPCPLHDESNSSARAQRTAWIQS
jgi:hypothetical protein